jgi:hypothetical protein
MVYRGSIARRLIWLSTLRRGSYPPTTQDSLLPARRDWSSSTGRDWLPAGFPTKGFKFAAILLSWTYLAQGQARLPVWLSVEPETGLGPANAL